MIKFTKIFRALLIGIFSVSIFAISSNAEENPIIAIDIVLKPDARLSQLARACNSELLKDYADGFALDDSHHPHITLLQRFVKRTELDKICAATAQIMAKEKPSCWKLNAYKYACSKDKDLGLAFIAIKPTPDMIRLQRELIDSTAAYTVATGDAAAFVTTPDQPVINEPTIHFVESFLTLATGDKFNPHVTTGLGTADFLEKLIAKRFDAFTFSPAGAAVYQLGNFGTARKELKSFE